MKTQFGTLISLSGIHGCLDILIKKKMLFILKESDAKSGIRRSNDLVVYAYIHVVI